MKEENKRICCYIDIRLNYYRCKRVVKLNEVVLEVFIVICICYCYLVI